RTPRALSGGRAVLDLVFLGSTAASKAPPSACRWCPVYYQPCGAHATGCDAAVSATWAKRSLRGLRSRNVGIEQAMHMHNEVSHLGVVACPLCGGLPRPVGLRIVGIDADDVELRQIGELHAFQ